VVGVLSPVLFSIYVDSIIERLRMSGCGCGCVIGRIMLAYRYAYIRQDILELHCVQVNVLVWICVQQNPISILVLIAYFTMLLAIRMNLCAYCKPYLLYGSECMDLNVTQIRSIEHTWQTVNLFYHNIFHFKGADVRNVCNYVTYVPQDCIHSIGVCDLFLDYAVNYSIACNSYLM